MEGPVGEEGGEVVLDQLVQREAHQDQLGVPHILCICVCVCVCVCVVCVCVCVCVVCVCVFVCVVCVEDKTEQLILCEVA